VVEKAGNDPENLTGSDDSLSPMVKTLPSFKSFENRKVFSTLLAKTLFVG